MPRRQLPLRIEREGFRAIVHVKPGKGEKLVQELAVLRCDSEQAE